MQYKLLRQDMNPGVWTLRGNMDLDIVALRDGRPIPGLAEPVRIELSQDSEEKSDFFDSPYFVVSNTMKGALESFGVDNIDYYRAILFRTDTGGEFDDFWLGNVLGVVSCVDEGNSSFKELRPGKRILRQFAVDEPATRDMPLFRLGEDRTLVLVSEPLRQHLESAGLSGIYFQDPGAFDGKPASSFWE